MTACVTESKSEGKEGLPICARGPCRSQNPASFITLVSPQSQAPPACDLYRKKLCKQKLYDCRQSTQYIPKHVKIMALVVALLKTFGA